MTQLYLSNQVAIDDQSKIRGLGRYTAGLQAIAPQIVEHIQGRGDVYINPFLNIIAQPKIDLGLVRSKTRIAVIHDVIPLTLTQFPWIGIKGAIWDRCNRYILRLYNKIVTDSHASKVSISRHLMVHPDRIRVIYPYSPIEKIEVPSSPAHLPSGLVSGQYMVYVGDVNWHKNIVPMAQAAVRAQIPLVCVGAAFRRGDTGHPWQSVLREFMEVAEGHRDIIRSVGFVDDVALASIYHHACANILVSLDEGFGYSYVEAGIFGAPSILSDIPVFREISGDNGVIYVDPQDVDQIVLAMQTLIRDPSKRNTLGGQAYRQSMKYSAHQFKSDWISLLETVIPQL